VTSSRITAGDVAGTIGLFLIFILAAFFTCLLDAGEAAAHPLHAATSGDDVMALLDVFGLGAVVGLLVAAGVKAMGKARPPMGRGEKPTSPRPPVLRGCLAFNTAVEPQMPRRLLPSTGGLRSYAGYRREPEPMSDLERSLLWWSNDPLAPSQRFVR
jgi:hypothetical protein